MDIYTYIIVFSIALLILSGVFVVKQQTSALIERFGKFIAIRNPGLHIKIPLIDKIAGRVSMRILQLDVIVETKTKDAHTIPSVVICNVCLILFSHSTLSLLILFFI